MSHRITKHAQRRIEQRSSLPQGPRRLYKTALQKGYNIVDFEGDFHEYLLKASSYKLRGVKVYQNLLFIYNKNSKNLITVIDLTNKWGDVTRYLKR